MKHILLLLVMLSASMNMNAQTMKIYKGETLVKEYDITEADKVVFEDVKGDSHEYVDLGLPSGTLWATCNLGATDMVEFGCYYAWGELQEKNEYYIENYRFYKKETVQEDGFDVTYSGYTKYVISQGGFRGYCDELSKLELTDDVAHQEWGGSWRIPTRKEAEELVKKCTWTRVTKDGVAGFKIVGPNGKFIFLPGAGIKQYGAIMGANNKGYCNYLTSEIHNTETWLGEMMYSLGDGEVEALATRFFGYTVRPVCSKE